MKVTKYSKFIFIDVVLKISCPFDDLQLVSASQWDIVKDENTRFEISKSYVPSSSGTMQTTSYCVRGIYKLPISDKRFMAFIDREVTGLPVRRIDSNKLISTFLQENIEKCIQETSRIIENIRCVFNLSGGYHKEDKSLHWSKDESNWNIIDLDGIDAVVVANVSPIVIDTSSFNNLLNGIIRNSSLQEPIHHKMIREADDLKFRTPKSSIVIGVAALEVAVKHFVAMKSPSQAEKLLESQSPEIYKILKEIIPNIIPEFSIPQIFLDQVRVIVLIRNELVHAGKFNLTIQSVCEKIDLIRDLIHLVDHYSDYTNFAKYHQKQDRLNPDSKPIIQNLRMY